MSNPTAAAPLDSASATPFSVSAVEDNVQSAAGYMQSDMSNLLFSRDAARSSSGASALRESAAKVVSRRSDTLQDQGFVKFLIDFVIMYIREDFKLNAGDLFASRYVARPSFPKIFLLFVVTCCLDWASPPVAVA
jgi:hypothetical protein